MSQTLQELLVRSLHQRTLVKIDLLRRRLPVDPCIGILFEEKDSRQSNSPSQFERRRVQHQQVDSVGQQNVP